jgi:hypothetical protein
MLRKPVHMRDQKHNQIAMLSRTNRQAAINMAEEVIMIAVLWGMFFLVTAS